MQLSPKEVLKEKIITNVKKEQIQQVGIDLTIAEDISIQHGRCANVAFEQKFDMKKTFGIIIQRSSFSRDGIFLTSGVYDPGFNGVGGCTIYNMSGKAIAIQKGMRVGQMVVFKANYAKSYNGFYNSSDSITSKGDKNS